ncbi:hypothetical protein PCASD_06524 [Puccinia coronata f. sp. avenae]|uniref:Uncharacterized protein n=1 Tax=Puccinia coronata f. sp. avenae TaxID=200324 RepID=A0A2N5TFN3_9BASI|nr:hypothetical protein PCASD_06524 [Puccinia coronata f. sp. avenae]
MYLLPKVAAEGVIGPPPPSLAACVAAPLEAKYTRGPSKFAPGRTMAAPLEILLPNLFLNIVSSSLLRCHAPT